MPSTSFEALYLKIAMDNMPFALDDLGVIFCEESIRLKIIFSRPQIFFPGGISDPLYFTPLKKHLLPYLIHPFQHYIVPFGMYI